jgi:hypothetical protein
MLMGFIWRRADKVIVVRLSLQQSWTNERDREKKRWELTNEVVYEIGNKSRQLGGGGWLARAERRQSHDGLAADRRRAGFESGRENAQRGHSTLRAPRPLLIIRPETNYAHSQVSSPAV